MFKRFMSELGKILLEDLEKNIETSWKIDDFNARKENDTCIWSIWIANANYGMNACVIYKQQKTEGPFTIPDNPGDYCQNVRLNSWDKKYLCKFIKPYREAYINAAKKQQIEKIKSSI